MNTRLEIFVSAQRRHAYTGTYTRAKRHLGRLGRRATLTQCLLAAVLGVALVAQELGVNLHSLVYKGKSLRANGRTGRGKGEWRMNQT